MDKWRKFRSLSAVERSLLLRGLVLLGLTAVALRLIGFRLWHSLLARLSAGEPAAPGIDAQECLERASLTGRMVRAAAQKGLRRTNCLEQSLVVWWLLRRQGISCELRIGARKQDGRFEAHAWVERSGVVLNDSDGLHRHYSSFEKSILATRAEPR